MSGQWRRLRKVLVAALLLPFIVSVSAITSAPAAHAVNTQADSCASSYTGTATLITTIPGYCVLQFTGTGSASWTVPIGVSFVQYLIVAGGGAGGIGSSCAYEAGGGGAGGVLTGYTNLAPGSTQSISVGAGGTFTSSSPVAAGNTTAFGLTTYGGGYGGYNCGAGGSGGSGGGGSHNQQAGGGGTSGQGNNGEQASYSSASGGGGGAGGPGIGGNGGMGIASNITGTDTYYGDGGAAGHAKVNVKNSSNVASVLDLVSRRGGSGGGGTGPSAVNQSGGAATGYGGGGAGADGPAGYTGGAGYQGTVVIRWASVPVVNGLTGYFRNDSSAYTDVMLNAITTDPNYCYSGIYTTSSINWGTGNPNSSDGSIYTNQPSTTCNSDNFTGYFYGYVKAPYTGVVTITESTDDGIVLQIDSQTVISRMSGSASSSNTINMIAGQILPIEIWFHEATGSANISLSWSYPGQSSINIPAAYLGTTPAALVSSPTVLGACQIGSSQSCPAYSPQEIYNLYGTTTNGTYWLLVNGVAQQVYSIMDTAIDGGGYVLVMKGASGANTFQYSSTHWTTNSTLNDTSGYLRRNDTANEDAKTQAFNYLPANKILAIFPSMTGSPTGAISGQSYGFTWNESVPNDAYNVLGIFNNQQIARTEVLDNNSWIIAPNAPNSGSICNNNNGTCQGTMYRQKLRKATSTDYGYSGSSSRFSTQTNVNWYGFNYQNQEWNNTSPYVQVRWGFGFNENYTSDEQSNDVAGGIGLHFNSTTESAGDVNSCCATYSGVNSSVKFEMYAKMLNPSISAPTNFTAVAHTGGTVTLSWNKATSSAPTEYVIQCHIAGTAWNDASLTTQRVVMPGDTTSVTVNLSGVATTTNQYEYRIWSRATYGTTWVNTSSAASSSATTYKTPIVPTISLQPVDTSTTSGLVAKFKVTASTTDAGNLSYQWQKSTTSGGSTFANTSYGADTTTTLITSTLSTSDSGYKFRVIVINTIQGETNSATSNIVTLTVNPPLTYGGASSIAVTIGKARTDTTTISGGTGTKSISVTLWPANAGITTDTSTLNSDGKIKITSAANALLGSFTETLTVTDTAGATATLVIPISVNSVPTFGGGGITTSGMVLNLDAGNSQSYAPVGATTWNDLSQVTGNVTLGTPTSAPKTCASPPYTSNNLGSLNFSSTGGYCAEVSFPNSYNNFSVESWVNFNSINGAWGTSAYGNYYAAGGNAINFALFLDGTSKLIAGIYDGTTWWYADKDTPYSPQINTWYDVVQTYDTATSSYKMYVNGSLYSSITQALLPVSTQKWFLIGHRWDSDNNNLEGQLPVLRIYNRALTSSEVSANYSALLPRFTGSLATARTVSSTAGKAYSPYTYTASDGTPTKVLSLTGTGAGVTVDTTVANLAILNVPSTLTAGTYYETVTVVDTNSSTTILPVTLTVNPAISLATSYASLQTTLGIAASDTVVATLGTGTKTFTLQSSPSNAGITLDTSTTNQAVLKFAGTVTAGTYTETITATDSATATATSVITVTVNPVVVISGSASLQSTSGTAFTSGSYLATLGTGTKAFTLSVSPSNAGITLDTSTTNAALIKVAASVSAQSYTITLTTTDSVTSQSTYSVTLIVNPAITFTGTQAQIRKYGATKSDTFTATNGTGNKALTITPTIAFITWDTSTLNTARINIATGLVPGTYLETITATDSVSATAQYLVTITSTLADTLTVSVDTITSVTYNTMQVAVTPKITVTGLVNGDTGTAATFNYTGINGTTYVFSTTKPTNAGSYSVSPSALTLTSGSPSYYTAINYVANTLTVNKAHQNAVVVAGTTGFFGTPLPIYVTGGSGTGSVTDTVTIGSSASGCSIAANILTSTSLGYCNVQAVKSGDTNYLDETSTVAAVYFFQYISFIPAPVTNTSGPTISLDGGGSVPFVIDAVSPLSITSFTPTTGGSGTSVVITGAGFTGVTDVRFGRTPATSFVVNSSTQITAIVPGTINGVHIVIYTSGKGVSVSAATYGP